MPISIRRGVGRDRATPLPDSDLQVLSTVSRVRAWTLTGLATLALAITLIHRQALAALAVTVTASLGISDVKYGWLSSGLAGAFLIGSLPGARFVQRIGPQLGLALTVAVTSIVIGMHSDCWEFYRIIVAAHRDGFRRRDVDAISDSNRASSAPVQGSRPRDRPIIFGECIGLGNVSASGDNA